MMSWRAMPLPALLVTAVYTIAWLLLDTASVAFETAPEVALFYPPPALDFVLVLVWGPRYLPALLLPRLLDVWCVQPVNLPPIVGLVYALLSAIVYGATSFLLVRHLRVQPTLQRFRDVFRFVLSATLLAPLLLAILAMTYFAIVGVIPWSDLGKRMLHFWAGDSVGIASLAPFLLVCAVPWLRSRLNGFQFPRLPQAPRWLLLEWLLETVTLLGGTWISFGLPIEGQFRFLYVCFLPMIWLTVRYGLAAASLAILVINSGAAAIVATQLVPPPLGIELVTSQFCMLAVSQTALLLGATINRRRQALIQIQSQTRREQLLNHIGRSLNSTRDPDLVLQEIVRLTGESFQVDRVVLWQLGEEQMSAMKEWCKDSQIISLLATQSAALDWLSKAERNVDLLQREPFQAYDYALLPHSSKCADLIRQVQLRSVLRVPIFIREQFFGNLSLHTTTDYRTFSPEEVSWLEQIAEQAGVALYNARSFEHLESLVQHRTQALEQEKRLSEAANLAKSEFLTYLSHELRTPLTSIQGFSSVLLEQVFGALNDRQLQYLNAIHTSGDHLLELINDILDLARIEARREELHLESIVVEDLCRRCLTLVTERAQRQQIELRLEIAPDVTTCWADRRRLISNSGQFALQCGQVH